MADTDTLIAIGRTLRYIDESGINGHRDQLDDIAHTLSAAPLGATNPAMEAAIATARFAAELDDYTTFRSKLRKALEAAHPEDAAELQLRATTA